MAGLQQYSVFGLIVAVILLFQSWVYFNSVEENSLCYTHGTFNSPDIGEFLELIIALDMGNTLNLADDELPQEEDSEKSSERIPDGEDDDEENKHISDIGEISFTDVVNRTLLKNIEAFPIFREKILTPPPEV